MSDELVIHVNIVEAADLITPADVGHAIIAVAEAEDINGGEISITFVDATTIASHRAPAAALPGGRPASLPAATSRGSR